MGMPFYTSPRAPVLVLLLTAVVAGSHLLLLPTCSAQSSLCRATCGDIPVRYPLGVDDGCGSPYYRSLLVCEPSSPPRLHLRTPSGTYPVLNISYADPHLVVSDPSMWGCDDVDGLGSAFFRHPGRPPFSLDASTRLSLSPKNDFLFLNCSREAVIVEPRSSFCERFPDRCDSACDSSAYLCRNMPGCPGAITVGRGGAAGAAPCCAYYPKASESVRLMLRHCTTYTSVYWRAVGLSFPPYDQVPEFGVRVDFEVPVTTRCLQCQDPERGGGTCGYDTVSRAFLCLCQEGNATANCADDGRSLRHKTSTGVVVGATTGVSVAGIVGVGALVWFLKKMKPNKVTCGVQSNENRMF
uniref:Wall-associated receptor kinase 5 n=1 Tax=Anthurium amnicola TaxID=1678845 RepID=A0A1D1Y0Z6_9ARAE